MSNIKYNIEMVSNYISSFGYALLSTEYVNTKHKLSIICPNGHEYGTSFSQFKRGDRCKICSGKNKHTYELVKSYIEKEGYSLLSTSYSHGKEMLKVMCEKGHEYNVCFNNFQQGKRCPICKPKYSKGEKELCGYIKTLYNGTIIENDRTVVRNPFTNKMLELDIYLPDKKLAFEYNGDYWHSTDDIKYRDNQKKIQCRNNGINLITIFENEWLNYNDECLKIRGKNIIEGRK
jgi:hypothetical protein